MDRLEAKPPSPTDGQKSDSPAAEKRRTTRLSIAVPITVSGIDLAGERFQEETNTLNINRHGALLALHRRVAVGSQLTIENRFLEISLRARVVSFRDRISPADPDHVAVELAELKNIWGIQYPPRDWFRAVQQQPAPQPSAVPAPSVPPLASSHDVSHPAPAAAIQRALAVPAASPSGAPAAASTPIDIDVGAFERQATQSAEALLNTFGEKLAKLGAQLGTRVQADVKAAADQADDAVQRLSALDNRLGDLSRALQGTLARAETMLSAAGELPQRSAQEIRQHEEKFRQQLQQALGSVLEDFDRRISQRVLASTVAQKEQHSRLQQDAAESMRAIQDRLRGQVETMAKEVLSVIPVEIDRSRAEALAQISAQVEEQLSAAVQRFEERLESLSAQSRAAACERTAAETLARLTPELEARQDRFIDETRERVQQPLEAALAEFGERLQAAAVQVQATTVERMGAETLAALAPELEACHQAALQKAGDRAQQSSAAALEEFERQLRANAAKALEESTGRFSDEVLGALTSQLEGRRSEALEQTNQWVQQQLDFALAGFQEKLESVSVGIRQSAAEQLTAELAARLAPQLEACQAESVEETRRCVQQSLKDGLGEFSKQLEAAAAEARDAASRRLTAEVLNQLLPEISSRQQAVVDQAEKRLQETFQAELADFARRAEATAAQAQQTVLETLAEETRTRWRPVLEVLQAELLDEVRVQVAAEIDEGVRSLRNHLKAEVAGSQKSADAALEKPSELIRKYAEDTVAMLREQMTDQQHAALASAKLEVQAMVRSTLTSLNEEATAFSGEFREQMRSVWEGMKFRGAGELESLHKEAMEQHRDVVLAHLQKDAEDMTDVAVGQFRSQSEEAIREANDAIHKQVGAAAFLLKDWMDHATTRLERCLEKFEERAASAFEAAQARSLQAQMAATEHIRRESEGIALELHDRFLRAASALRGVSCPGPGEAPSAAEGRGERPLASPAHIVREG